MSIQRKLGTGILALLLAGYGIGFAQDEQQGQDAAQQEQQSQEQAAQERPSFGQIQVGDAQPVETETDTVEVEVETGTIVFTGQTPDDQHPNIDLVGPDGYYESFEVGDDADEERVVEGLLPGIYSVAATDNDLQVAHTLVEVVAGQAVHVNVALDQFAQDYEPGTFRAPAPVAAGDPAFEGEQTAEGDANAQTGEVAGGAQGEPAAAPVYPAGAYDTRVEQLEGVDTGEIVVNANAEEDVRFVVTGPNAYSNEFSGENTLSDLAPGIYVIAATAEGHEVATSLIEVQATTRTITVPATSVSTDVEEVEGGGGAEQPETQETQETQPEEQPAEEQPAQKQPAEEEQPAEEQQQEEEPAQPEEEQQDVQ